MGLGHLGDLGGQLRPGAVGQTARLYVGAGDVHFDHVHPGPGQLLAHDAILLRGVAGDVGDDLYVEVAQEGQLLGNKGVHAGVLQPHGVEDAHGGLGDAGGGVALAGVQGQALGADTAQLAQVIKLAVLPAKAKGARGHHHRVLHGHPRQIDGEVDLLVRHSSPPPWNRTQGRPCTRACGCRRPCRRRTPGRRPRRSPCAPP